MCQFSLVKREKHNKKVARKSNNKPLKQKNINEFTSALGFSKQNVMETTIINEWLGHQPTFAYVYIQTRKKQKNKTKKIKQINAKNCDKNGKTATSKKKNNTPFTHTKLE